MSEYDYAWEKLMVAVDCIDGGDNPREGLLNALISALGRIKPAHDLPPEIREDFEQMMKVVTKIQTVGPVGGYEKNVEIFSDKAVSDAITQIKGFYDVVCSYREKE